MSSYITTAADGYVLDLLGDDDQIPARAKQSGLTIAAAGVNSMLAPMESDLVLS